MASSSKIKGAPLAESSREPTPVHTPPENLVFLVPEGDVGNVDLDNIFKRLAAQSSKEFAKSGSREYRTVIVRFERDAMDLPSFDEIVPKGTQVSSIPFFSTLQD